MSRREEGFTLLELLLAMTMMMIVFGTVASAFAVGLRSTDESSRRLDESQDGAFTANYLVKDVQSAQTVSVTDVCAGSGSPVVSLAWKDHTVDEQVTYRYAGTQLLRVACGTTAGTTVVARSLAAQPSLVCTPAPCSTPTTVTLTLKGLQDAVFEVTATRRLP